MSVRAASSDVRLLTTTLSYLIASAEALKAIQVKVDPAPSNPPSAEQEVPDGSLTSGQLVVTVADWRSKRLMVRPSIALGILYTSLTSPAWHLHPRPPDVRVRPTANERL